MCLIGTKTGFLWSSLIAPESETPVPSSLLESSLFPFSVPSSSFLPQFLSLQYKEMVYYGRLGKKVGTFWSKTTITGCKWASLNAPRSEISVSHSLLESSLFLISAPAPSSLWVNKNWFIMGGWVKKWKYFGTK